LGGVEIAVFGYGRSMVLNDTALFSTNSNDLVVEVLTPPITVPVNVYVPDGDPDALTFANLEAKLAVALFTKNRSGLLLSPTVNDTVPGLLGTGKGCDDAAHIQGLGPPLYQSDRLNIYFVKDIVWSSTDFLGLNCIDQGGMYAGPGSIMFVSIPEHLPTVVAHEIGHGLSLRHAGTEYAGFRNFTLNDIMINAWTTDGGKARNLFTLGQVYRMNADKRSWLNNPAPGASPARNGRTKTCSEDIAGPTVPAPGHGMAMIRLRRALPPSIAGIVTLIFAVSAFAQAPLTQTDRRLINAWLLCIECNAGQLDSVAALARRKPVATRDTLTRDLLAGPSAQLLDDVQQQLGENYDVLAAQAASEARVVGVSRSEYLKRYTASVQSVYRRRAALALARIGGPQARQALTAALDSARRGSPNFDSRLTRAIMFARDSLRVP